MSDCAPKACIMENVQNSEVEDRDFRIENFQESRLLRQACDQLLLADKYFHIKLKEVYFIQTTNYNGWMEFILLKQTQHHRTNCYGNKEKYSPGSDQT